MAAIKKRKRELRKLERRVEELEGKVEQLKKRTGDNKAFEIIVWTTAILELATAIIALSEILTG